MFYEDLIKNAYVPHIEHCDRVSRDLQIYMIAFFFLLESPKRGIDKQTSVRHDMQDRKWYGRMEINMGRKSEQRNQR